MKATQGFRNGSAIWTRGEKERLFDALERKPSRASNGSVLVFLVSEETDQTVLVMEEGRPDPKWRVPGGGIEQGECPIEAALREIAEETGINLRLEQLDLFEPERRHGERYWPYFFVAKIDEKQLEQRVPRTRDGGKWLSTLGLPVNQLLGLNNLLDQHRRRIERVFAS